MVWNSENGWSTNDDYDSNVEDDYDSKDYKQLRFDFDQVYRNVMDGAQGFFLSMDTVFMVGLELYLNFEYAINLAVMKLFFQLPLALHHRHHEYCD